MNDPRPKETLPDGNYISLDGDVCSSADLPQEATGQHPTEDEWLEHLISEDQRLNTAQLDTIAQIRANGWFEVRNDNLVEAARSVGDSKRHGGAAHKMEYGGTVSHYPSADRAEELSSEARERAVDLVKKACGRCALAEYCSINPEELVGRLNDNKDRTRFRKRVSRPDNNHLCGTNLGPGRLKDAIM